MAHLACEQLVGFLSLLALGDIEEDAEHNPISDVSIISLASSRNPSNGAAGQNSKINLVRPYNGPSSRKSGPYAFQVGRVDVLRQDLESDFRSEEHTSELQSLTNL